MKATTSDILSLAFLSLSYTTNAAVRLDRRDAPATLDGGYTYLGCFTDVPGRTLTGAATADAGMTNEECGAFCLSKGFKYAGTEYYNECFCGSDLKAGSVEAPEGECNTPCAGDATQPCGGGDRLTLYVSESISGPATNPGVDGFGYIGCYSEGTTGRALTYGVGTIPPAEMTVAKCVAACKALDFTIAGVEYAAECFCGNEISNGGAPAAGGCTMTCNGLPSEFCGGPDRLNVYSSDEDIEPEPTTASPPGSSTSTTPGGSSSTTSGPEPTDTMECPAQPAAVANYDFYGCYTEATGIRALSQAATAGADMTNEACAAFCADYDFFGTEYSQECFCGNFFNEGSVLAPASECDMLCTGDACQFCGAGNRLSVYAKNGTPPDTTTTPGSTTSGTAGPSEETETPVPDDYPEGWESFGCYVDGAEGRILGYQAPDSQTLTQGQCAQICLGLGYSVSGTEFSYQCFCGNRIINNGVPAPEAECSTACSGDPSEKCGGPDRMTIVAAPPLKVGVGPQVEDLPGQWEYSGCVVDNINDKRTFKWQSFFPGTMTASDCLNLCAEFKYAAAGLEYGEECYCGDEANIDDVGSYYVDDSECNIACAGDSDFMCGGGARLSTYFWTGGEPLYEWDFATGWEAGQYDDPFNGVCIPLLTQQSITGKVTFLEKWGTGPANSTGAYELDLSLEGDFAHSWREMHVLTDIFCGAGVTLPDKAGRQLNVGGWSGESTYGVRLYTPDGSAGVNGTNDWEENVYSLSLQDGRWYPSVMIMTNGSILVIGGEEGSNAAPVPTLEILPYTGGAPLFMDWLERTDPNNLYPYICVLPGGGIFVAYWNEARILDEVTFETTRRLPDAPGAVNDPLGGRTYPLEGTGVLLPQRYPYTDYLGILICGGSTIGVANALDNCVTIEPDDPDAEWVLERMPSQRVISCMAPLPDGTYLILNGAHHGVAGFGLANDPNFNAVLYDPRKPVHKRMTIMANTTIARMYHSEAITLLDGRVLVSGSDPQDEVNPQEYRVETFTPPYLLKPGVTRPSFAITDKDWAYGDEVTFTLGGAPANGGDGIEVSLLGSVSSTHGNSMGARTLFPKVECAGTTCTVTAPPTAYIAPPGWYQMFVLDGGIPAEGTFVRIGGDPAGLGNWPAGPDFTPPGV